MNDETPRFYLWPRVVQTAAGGHMAVVDHELNDTGRWVKHSDHRAKVIALEAHIEALVAEAIRREEHLKQLESALLDLRSDLRDESERQGGPFHRFYQRVNAVLAVTPTNDTP